MWLGIMVTITGMKRKISGVGRGCSSAGAPPKPIKKPWKKEWSPGKFGLNQLLFQVEPPSSPQPKTYLRPWGKCLGLTTQSKYLIRTSKTISGSVRLDQYSILLTDRNKKINGFSSPSIVPMDAETPGASTNIIIKPNEQVFFNVKLLNHKL